MSTFDPWTSSFEAAQAAEAAFDGATTDPESPLPQWLAAQAVIRLRPSIDAGDGFAVMDAVARCARRGLAMPAWLSLAYLARYDKVLNCRVGSWDEAFGRPYRKGAQMVALRNRRMARLRVANIVAEFVRRFPHESVEALYSAASATGKDLDTGHIGEYARRLGVGRTAAQELYAEAVALGFAQPVEEIRSSLRPRPYAPAKFAKLAGVKRRR